MAKLDIGVGEEFPLEEKSRDDDRRRSRHADRHHHFHHDHHHHPHTHFWHDWFRGRRERDTDSHNKQDKE